MTSHAISDMLYLKIYISIYALEVKMMEKDSRHGLNRLEEVPDKRNPRGKRHPLPAILGLSVIAMMCGYRSYSAIAQWGGHTLPNLL